MTPIGVGAWSWGDRSGYWGDNLSSPEKKEESYEAYRGLVESGIGLIDTSEVTAGCLHVTHSLLTLLLRPSMLRHLRWWMVEDDYLLADSAARAP